MKLDFALSEANPVQEIDSQKISLLFLQFRMNCSISNVMA